jgi:hypothetical protein
VVGKDEDGLHPDASDHSIKALEAVLKPTVVPNNASATLGHILGEIKARLRPTRCAVSNTRNDVEGLKYGSIGLTTLP